MSIKMGWLAIALVASGCLAPSSQPNDPFPQMGLGLEISEIPAVGSFRENSVDLEVLEQFLRKEGYDIIESCEKPEEYEIMERYVEEERYSRAFDHIFSACLPTQYVEDMVAQAIEENTQRDVRIQLLSEAKSAISEVEDGLSNHEGPGNTVESQLLSKLFVRHIRHTLTLEGTTHQKWKAYDNGTQKTELQLKAAYMGYYNVVKDSEIIGVILDEYPWSESVCARPDVGELVQRIDSKIQQAHKQAESRGHDEVIGVYESHTAYENVQYNSLMNWIIPRFEYMDEHEWWPGLMSVEISVERRLSYMDSFDDTAWPTEEEAEFMLAQHRNESRTLWHEANFEGFVQYFSDDEARRLYEWGDDRPAVFLSLLSMRWPFEDLDCPESAIP